MARADGVQEDFRTQIERFYELLEQAVDPGDTSWLDNIPPVWASSITETDLAEGKTNLSHFLREILQITFDVCRENLAETEAMELIAALLPSLRYPFEKAAQYEMQTRVDYISSQLMDAQQSLERLERSKSDFIADAAHELKTPLTLVEGYAVMLKDSLAWSDDQALQIETLLNGIRSGTRRLRVIIDDIIDVSLMDNNSLNLNYQPLWFTNLLAVFKDELARSFEERNLIFRIEPFPGSYELTFGDPERLMQVFRNILTNAIKFTPDGGKISVDGRKLPGFIEITITDTGIGIDSDDQQIIFDKFGHLGNTALHSSGKIKFKGGGPGLGLHIAKGIVEAHGEAIWVDSPGYDEKCCPGSTFHVLLPMRTQPPDDKSARLFAVNIDNHQEKNPERK